MVNHWLVMPSIKREIEGSRGITRVPWFWPDLWQRFWPNGMALASNLDSQNSMHLVDRHETNPRVAGGPTVMRGHDVTRE
ncbi:hypothetical protein PoB_005878000 [Plakobranchus ocellatus]|uniref:Uncharacterized protein n=1 Tax=Plakobranchus ocellatus TaxID=259542 RepID=A0AAV4CHC1_9GAST|nr:hypothetical protein PoB_005878000 [Plakobranchus ocellatus]